MNIEMYRIFFNIQKQHWWFVAKKDIVLGAIHSHVALHKDCTVLDIGCGSGLMLNALDELANTSGMDMSNEAIQFSQEIFSGPIKQGSLPDNVPFPNESFDLITALDVVEHIDDDIGSLKAIRHLLKPSGKAVITVPAYMFLWSSFDDMNEHKRRYTLPELRQKLNSAGFQIEKISYFNSLLFPIVYIVRKLNNLMGRDGASDVDMPSKALNYILRQIFGLEKYLLRCCSLPFGVSILAVVKK
jgi:2-polyprenyl-3-methyl-5-hydroxy-6-metoxy-1,4-benzoquinol methylase